MTEIDRHANRLQALAESTQLFAEASTDVGKLLAVVAMRFSELVGEAVNIRLVERDALVPVASYHPDAVVNEYLHDAHDATPLKIGEGISGQVMATGEPYYEPSLDLAATVLAMKNMVPERAKAAARDLVRRAHDG